MDRRPRQNHRSKKQRVPNVGVNPLARGPAIVSRAALAYDATVDDGAKIITKIGQLAAAGILARDTA